MTTSGIDTKYCTSCQSNQPVEGGYLKRTKSSPRWICRGCHERTTPSIYRNQTGKQADVAKIMAALYGRLE